MLDWNRVIDQALVQAPAILGGAAAIIVAVGRWFHKLDQRQQRIEKKVNGNHRQEMRAIRAQGQLEGIKTGKQIVHEDLERATKAISKASKRGKRRSTDK